MESPSAARSVRVDFLRGVAIFLVLLLHFSLTYDLIDSPLSRVVPAAWLRAAIENGNYGVTMFFVISGFLITSNNLLRYGRLADVDLRDDELYFMYGYAACFDAIAFGCLTALYHRHLDIGRISRYLLRGTRRSHWLWDISPACAIACRKELCRTRTSCHSSRCS